MDFGRIEKTTVPQQVAASIREAILSGDLQPGDTLPSERSLADRFGVNRSSVREALHRLEARGFVRIRQGGATVVEDVLVTAGLHLLPFLIAPGGTPDIGILEDLLSLRVVLLRWTAEQAAVRGGDVERLRELVQSMDADPDAEQLQLADFDFFQEMVDMSGNRVLKLVMNAIRRVYTEHRELFMALYAGFDTSDHHAAVDAIERGDVPAAGAAMEAYANRVVGILRGAPRES